MPNIKMEIERIKHLDEPTRSASFMRARDPSIISGNRVINPALCVNLFTNMEESNSNVEDSKDTNHLRVYLRIKPSDDLDALYKIIDNVLSCRPPPDSHTSRNNIKSMSLLKTFKFSKIYNVQTTQLDIFNDSVKKNVLDFINGQNSTLFTYGTSGSGKTYTILGTANEPGIIPRALEYTFRTLPFVEKVPSMKLLPNGQLKCLNQADVKAELDLKANLLKGSAVHFDKAQHEHTYSSMQQRLSTESVALLEGNLPEAVSIWISFVEIYNEQVLDLLVDEVRSKRRPLQLGQDSSGRTYIKDLTSVSAASGLEAYELLQRGMQNMNYASTRINAHSSRSHCVFMVKLLQWASGGEHVQSSSFSFCDLAGSERLKRTLNVGKRLQESNNINTSLHVLSRCIKSVRSQQQKSRDLRLVPFRDSKLTRIFQTALSGKESIAMMVNMSSESTMFDESQHVLNFSAVAQDIQFESAVMPKILRLEKNVPRRSLLPKIDESRQSNEMISMLCQEIDNLKMHYETEVRAEYCKLYEQRNNDWQEYFNQHVQMMEEAHAAELEHLRIKENIGAKRQRVICLDSSSSEDDDDELQQKLQKIEKLLIDANLENAQLRSEISDLKSKNSDLKNEISQMKSDVCRQTQEE